MRSTTWRAANEAFVAITMEGVGPGVKMEEMRSAKNVAIVNQLALARSSVQRQRRKGQHAGSLYASFERDPLPSLEAPEEGVCVDF